VSSVTEISPEEALVVNVRGGARVCVPPFLNQITSFVLLEQEDWFEDEIRFVRAWLQPGMRAVDVGANYGVYTLAAALRVGAAGRVWAIEPTPLCAAFLRRSLELNGCAQAQVVERVVSDRRGSVRFALKALSETNAVAAAGEPAVELPARTLDELAAELGWSAVDFLKLDVEGHELQAIGGGGRFLGEQSPLVMIEVQASGTFERAPLERLAALGYAAYRLLPGPLILVPVAPGEAWDRFQINLFACKPDRAAKLAQAGLLAAELPGEDVDPPADAWARYAASAPYARTFAQRWLAKAGLFSSGGTGEYFDGLAAFAASRATGLPAERRWALLERAFHAVEPSLDSGGPLRRLSYSRLAWELGRREVAAHALAALGKVVEAPLAAGSLVEPFLAPSPRYEALEWAPDPAAWLRCAVLEQFERLRHFSSIFVSDGTEMVIVDALAGMPQRSPEMERRAQLLRIATGRQAGPLPAELLRGRSDENLNPEFWCSPSR